MAEEPDQTKWVGIRPATGCNNIPVASEKQAPAISDLAAITDNLSRNWYANAQDCSVEKFISLAAVPAGEIWCITNISMRNDDSLCDMEMTLKDGVAIRSIKSWYSIPAEQNVTWNGLIVLRPVMLLRGYYRLGGVTDDFRLFCQGWKIEEY